jgi:plastocyanin
MTRAIATLCSILVLGVVAAGCGGSDKSGSSDSSSSGGSTAPKSSAPAKSTAKPDVKVVMKNIQFMPMNITVKKGQTVQWTNNDSVTHNVTKDSGPGASFKSPNVNPGSKYQTTFDTPGKVHYLCTIHPNQTGTITVK